MNFEELKYVHFIGIGGIGMSALARYFNFLGKNISGYDRTSTTLTSELIKEGMNVYFEDNADCIPKVIREKAGTKEVLIIYTPAIPKEHEELQLFHSKGVTLYKRAEILGEISKKYETIGIAGTHGKTTTTSLLTYICQVAGLPFISFVGGINENFNSNLVIHGDPKFVITEADEFDRSFLKLSVDKAILTSMDADHLDIYGDADSMTESFKEFANLVREDGFLLVQEKIQANIPSHSYSYSISSKADYTSSNIQFIRGKFEFNFKGPKDEISNIKLGLPGYHNLENATAAIAMAINLGADEESIKKALDTYKGVKRRFEYQINREDFIYIDDYAHHPEEINAVISSLKKMYPGKKITGIFQPHLFSRTKDLAAGFAESLSKIDDLILLDIYPAREKPMPGITSAWLLDQIESDQKILCQKENLLNELKNHSMEILVSLGAGDIDKMVVPIKNQFEHE